MKYKRIPFFLICIGVFLSGLSFVGCQTQNDQAKESIKKAHDVASQAERQTQDTVNQAKKILDDSQKEKSE